MPGAIVLSNFLEELHPPLVAEILLRLPGKSLHQFLRLLRRSHILMSDPFFVRGCCHKTALTGFIYRHQLGRFPVGKRRQVKGQRQKFSVFIPDDGEYDPFVEETSKVVSFVKPSHPDVLADSHAGLLLWCDKNCQRYFVAEPFTRDWAAIPAPPTRVPHAAAKLASLGADRFKVVRLVDSSSPFVPTNLIEVETFSSETGEWKSTTFVYPEWVTPSRRPRCLTMYEDMICWLQESCMTVYCVQRECLILLPLPELLVSNGYLSVSGGSLYYTQMRNGLLEVWALVGHGGSTCTKLLQQLLGHGDYRGKVKVLPPLHYELGGSNGSSPLQWVLRFVVDMILVLGSHSEFFEKYQRHGLLPHENILLLPFNREHSHVLFMKIFDMICRLDVKEMSLKMVHRVLNDRLDDILIVPFDLSSWPTRIPDIRRPRSRSV